jgi:hypothetical protein
MLVVYLHESDAGLEEEIELAVLGELELSSVSIRWQLSEIPG